MQDPAALEAALLAELERLDIAARPVVVPTPWDVGPVTAYLFPTDPVTLIDAGVNTPAAREAFRGALVAEGLEPNDVRRIIVTHAHLDHFGGAVWLQAESSCQVHLHPCGHRDRRSVVVAPHERPAVPAARLHRGAGRELLVGRGSARHARAGVLADGGRRRVRDGRDDDCASSTTPDTRPATSGSSTKASGAIFVGDYLIGDHPTNAGMEVDESQPMGRAPLLQQYNAGLRELRDRPAPVLFPAHGPPITDHAALIDRRLAKSDRRTRHVLDGVARASERHGARDRTCALRLTSGAQLGGRADLVGRLDLLVAEGRVSARMGEDGAWHFTATT